MFQLDGHGTSQGEYCEYTSGYEALILLSNYDWPIRITDGISTKVKLNIDHVPNANGDLAPTMSKLDLKSKVKRGKIRMDNLFRGDKVLGDAVNDAINANFNVISSDFTPMIDKRLSQLLRDYTNKLFSHFTTEQLFPGLRQ